MNGKCMVFSKHGSYVDGTVIRIVTEISVSIILTHERSGDRTQYKFKPVDVRDVY